MTAQPSDSDYVFDGETVRLNAGKDPADRMHLLTGWRRYWLAFDPASSLDPAGEVIILDEMLPLWDRNRQVPGPRRRIVVHAARMRSWRYGEQVQHIAQLINSRHLYGRTRLVVDITGVGNAVGAMLDEAKIPFIGVMATAGASTTKVSSTRWNVSKSGLITNAAAALEHGSLQIAADLPEREALLSELASYTTKYTSAGNLVISAGDKTHHADMGSALCLAWFASENAAGGTFRQARLENFYG